MGNGPCPLQPNAAMPTEVVSVQGHEDHELDTVDREHMIPPCAECMASINLPIRVGDVQIPKPPHLHGRVEKHMEFVETEFAL